MSMNIFEFEFSNLDLRNFHLRQAYGGQAGGVGLFIEGRRRPENHPLKIGNQKSIVEQKYGSF